MRASNFNRSSIESPIASPLWSEFFREIAPASTHPHSGEFENYSNHHIYVQSGPGDSIPKPLQSISIFEIILFNWKNRLQHPPQTTAMQTMKDHCSLIQWPWNVSWIGIVRQYDYSTSRSIIRTVRIKLIPSFTISGESLLTIYYRSTPWRVMPDR